MKSVPLSLKKLSDHPLVTGTLILTLTGLVSRLIGFFYRIYLSRLFGEEKIGIYQLISPVIALSFSLCAAAYQTAVSKLSAELAAKTACPSHPDTRKPFWAALSISLPLSLLCTALTYLFAAPIGTILLKEPRTIPLLRIIAFSFPFVGIHACINGWFYGMKKAGLPALAQIIEQLTRVGCVFLITRKTLIAGQSPDISVAVFGLALGELVSMTVAIVTYLPFFAPCADKAPARQAAMLSAPTPSRLSSALPAAHSAVPSPCTGIHRTAPSCTASLSPCADKAPARQIASLSAPASSRPSSSLRTLPETYHALLAMVLPLTANRLVLNFLGSAESVAIPEMLRLYGYTTENALAVYGVLTGMALPLIFFPNALTGSIAVMLLPMISENNCLKKYDAVRNLTRRTLKYCLLMGFACMVVFVLLGPWLGDLLYGSPLAGRCIRTLGFICPFLYLDTTLSSILQGLGKAGVIFLINVLSLLVRLAFVYLAIPVYGIKGYLWGMLAGQLLLSALYLLCLRKFFKSR